MLLGGDIHQETFIGINEVVGFYKHLDDVLDDDYIWNETRDRLLKYRNFLKIDKNKIKEIMKNVYIT
jgi:hypothetical protein